MKGQLWIKTYVVATAALMILYLSFHFIHEGKEKVYFTDSQKEFLINQYEIFTAQTDTFTVADSSDSIAYEYYLLRNRSIVTEYLKCCISEEEINTCINSLFLINNKANFKIFLNDYQREENSFFWLNSNLQVIEVLFWSLIGVLCSLIFHGSEAMREGKFNEQEMGVHLGKLVYSPIVTLIIIYSGNVLLHDGTISTKDVSYWIIVLSFILGFYSRRAIDLLDRVKDLIFRSSEKTNVAGESEENENQVTHTKPDEKYLKLSKEEQHKMVADWMINESDQYVAKYNLTGITAGLKSMAGQQQDYYAIVFEVGVKRNVNDPLPRFVEYQGFHIPTDVMESPETESLSSPLSLASGISRKNHDSFGTLGIKVIRNGQELIMSCYHVLFPQELCSDQRETNGDTLKGDPDVLYPKDGKVIGKVVEGEMNSWIDIGFLEINEGTEVYDKWESKIGVFGSRYLDIKDEINQTYVKYWGAGSNQIVVLRIKNIFSNQPIMYCNRTIKQTINGLVVLNGPALSGDSGAPVFDSFGKFVGILIASNSQNAYLIPYSTIQNRTSIKIK